MIWLLILNAAVFAWLWYRSKQRTQVAKLIIDGEATRDPIFLVQTAEHFIHDLPRGWVWDEEDCDFVKADMDLVLGIDFPTKEDWPDADWDSYEEDPEYGLLMHSRELHGTEGVHTTWSTHRVFLTREEATMWAQARHYRWPHGWRVYCTVAEGQLTAVLDGVRTTK